jgi:hypothetical protein
MQLTAFERPPAGPANPNLARRGGQTDAARFGDVHVCSADMVLGNFRNSLLRAESKYMADG